MRRQEKRKKGMTTRRNKYTNNKMAAMGAKLSIIINDLNMQIKKDNDRVDEKKHGQNIIFL